MVGDLKGPILHRWGRGCQEKKGLAIQMRQGDASVQVAKLGEEHGQTGPGKGVTGGRLLQDGQLHRDSGSHWAQRQMGSEGGVGRIEEEGKTDTWW